MLIPKDRAFGICPMCGGTGGDASDAGGADKPASDLVRNGIRLELFRGQYWCPICIKEQLAREESEIEAERFEEEEEFRARAGFLDEVSDNYIT